MKKSLILLLTLLVSASVAGAQETTEKEYLPKKGDWAVGFDVSPILRVIGGIGAGDLKLGGVPWLTDNTTNLMPELSVNAKYMLSDKLGIKANVGLLLRSDSEAEFARDDAEYANNPLSDAKVEDRKHTFNSGISLMAGAEYRVGRKKVQGVFGAGVLFALQNTTTSYNYGNAMTSLNQSPSVGITNYTYNGGRKLSENGNPFYYAGLIGSMGVEWFVAPKISLGAQVDLSAYAIFKSKRYVDSERYDPASGTVEKRTDLMQPSSVDFHIGTDSISGSINMVFYF